MERERAEEEAEPMDWLDSVDPKGLMRQLLDCRKKSAALRGPIAAEEILAKVGIKEVGQNFQHFSRNSFYNYNYYWIIETFCLI